MVARPMKRMPFVLPWLFVGTFALGAGSPARADLRQCMKALFSGIVVNIDQMKAQTLDSHCSAKPVRFVLEMNDGWFAKRGIKAGQKLKGLPAVQ